MKSEAQKNRGEQLSEPTSPGQQEEKCSVIPLDETIKSLARELNGLGAKLANLAERRDLKFSYIVATTANNATANALRNSYLTLRERRISYSTDASARFINQVSSAAPNIYSGPASSDECYALLWMDDNDCEIVPKNKLHVDEKVIRYSEYRVESGIFPAFPELARKLNAREDGLSKYLWVQIPGEVKRLLEKWSQPDASTAWKKTPERSRHRIFEQFRATIENLLPCDWFCQVINGEDLTYEDQIVGLQLSPYLARLKSVSITPVDFVQLNRTILDENYPHEFPKMRPSRRVLLPLDAYLPSEFWAIAKDVCQTRSSSYPVADELLALGNEFLMAFLKERVVKIAACPARVTLNDEDLKFFELTRNDVQSSPKESFPFGFIKIRKELFDRFQAKEALGLVQDAHGKMLELVAEIGKAKVREIITEIVVSGDARSLKVTCSGAPVLLTGAQRRTIVCLALLAGKKWFSVGEFSDLYNGKDAVKGEVRKDFDRTIRILRGRLPAIGFDNDYKGNRCFLGFRLKNSVSHKNLQSLLVNLRGGQTPRSIAPSVSKVVVLDRHSEN